MRVYYNDNDKFCCGWVEKLIEAGLVPPGDIDGRSICDIGPDEVRRYDQCHFFNGIGGWPLALLQAGWGDRPVWTGSCPCQPFSSAGRKEGVKDERHLWPAFFGLIQECRPPVVLGEQVATAVGRGWLDIVLGDLEAEGYACGAAVLGAHSVGGPHIRQRIYWWGDRDFRVPHPAGTGLQGPSGEGLRNQACDKLDDEQGGREEEEAGARPPGSGADGGMGFWKGWEWLLFRDGKRRPVEPVSAEMADEFPPDLGLVRNAGGGYYVSPLVQSTKNREARLRGYGNAVVPVVAAEFIKAYMESTGGTVSPAVP